MINLLLHISLNTTNGWSY